MKRFQTNLLANSFLLLALSFSGMLSAQFVEEKMIEEEEKHFEHQMMNVRVVDENKQPVEATINVEGIDGKKTTVIENISDTTFEVK